MRLDFSAVSVYNFSLTKNCEECTFFPLHLWLPWVWSTSKSILARTAEGAQKQESWAQTVITLTTQIASHTYFHRPRGPVLICKNVMKQVHAVKTKCWTVREESCLPCDFTVMKHSKECWISVENYVCPVRSSTSVDFVAE